MGYISIQINKAKGSADTGASDHIERKTTPKNADPTRTHLNRELVEFPRRRGRPHRSDKPPHPHGRHQTEKLLPTKYGQSASCFRVRMKTW